MPNPDDLEQIERMLRAGMTQQEKDTEAERAEQLKEMFMDAIMPKFEKLKQTEEKKKLVLCLDFDGVLHSYVSGWKGVDVIPDPPVDGALENVREYVEHFDVWIVSSRTGEKAGRMAILDWLRKYDFPNDIMVSANKPAAFLTIDDRGWMFNGTFPSVEDIKSFKPWNKK